MPVFPFRRKKGVPLVQLSLTLVYHHVEWTKGELCDSPLCGPILWNEKNLGAVRQTLVWRPAPVFWSASGRCVRRDDSCWYSRGKRTRALSSTTTSRLSSLRFEATRYDWEWMLPRKYRSIETRFTKRFAVISRWPTTSPASRIRPAPLNSIR